MSCDVRLMKTFLTFTILISVFHGDVAVEDVKSQKEKYTPDYTSYHNLTTISSSFYDIVNKYDGYITKRSEFKSKAGHPQLVIRISNFTLGTSNVDKIKILLSYGEHAREFFPVESMLYFLANVTRGLDKSLEGRYSQAYSSWVVNNFDVYIIGMTNPDGREHIEKSENYCWRGNGAGIDLNRNFDWNYGGAGSSGNPSDGEYRGLSAFSEPETHVFKQLTASTRFDAFVSFHSGMRHIYIPFADTRSKEQGRRPKNIEQMLKLAQALSTSCHSRHFKFGLAHQLNHYTADGTSFDYMAGVEQIPFSFAIEMWEHRHHTGWSCFDEFNPESMQLEHELAMVHSLYEQLLSYLYLWKRGVSHRKQHPMPEKHMMPGLVRVKKYDGPHSPESPDDLYVSQASQEISHSAWYERKVTGIFFILVSAVCIALAARQICHQLKYRKRVISLKSLSSTFSLFK